LFSTILRATISLVVLVPITTYFLEPEDFGLFALLIALAMPIKMIGSAGSRWVIGGNYINCNKAECGKLLFNIILFEFIMRTMLAMILAFFSNELLFQPDLEVEVIVYIIISVILFKFYRLPGSVGAIKSARGL
jgi:hypothetical protein